MRALLFAPLGALAFALSACSGDYAKEIANLCPVVDGAKAAQSAPCAVVQGRTDERVDVLAIDDSGDYIIFDAKRLEPTRVSVSRFQAQFTTPSLTVFDPKKEEQKPTVS